jgi:hypothetical protein
MALKTSNKNRKKVEPIVESTAFPDTHEELFETITELADLNKTISFRSMLFSVVGVIIGITILLFII